ncbi:hypothetical protein HPP92_021688 [Vanilla planifolia]|uniref:AB hydrolase-1 domain-containing protein n=1 Tax=Vanilla planifolia TaxID=51239 RepID=A0A835UG20_VANPL|nr:hypothetical protein HPP92_022006 [Vanilla planifolia]KAG0463212.1 hypothetical protein HPP92_021688 [Vanilla planifolia]
MAKFPLTSFSSSSLASVVLSVPCCSALFLPLPTLSSPSTSSRGRLLLDTPRQFRHLKVFSGYDVVPPNVLEFSKGWKEIYERCTLWRWNGYSVNFFCKGSGPPLLLVHGFGASIAHWRRNIGVLSESYTVYAIDLLGFGSSDKPLEFSYSIELWSQLILDFLKEVVKKPTVLIGNSVGSLVCVMATTEASEGLVRGLVLLNCAGGMNNKAIVDDWRIRLIMPFLWILDFLLKKRSIALAIFEYVKKRENLKNILLSVYGNKEFVDDDLIEIIKKPAEDPGALDAFISIVTGPPGPSPVSLMPKLTVPVLILWGDQDPFTPIDGPVENIFLSPFSVL